MYVSGHVLVQKEKVNIDSDKGVQISMAVKKVETKGWSEVMVIVSRKAIITFIFYFLVIMFLSCYWCYQKTEIAFTGYF